MPVNVVNSLVDCWRKKHTQRQLKTWIVSVSDEINANTVNFLQVMNLLCDKAVWSDSVSKKNDYGVWNNEVIVHRLQEIGWRNIWKDESSGVS